MLSRWWVILVTAVGVVGIRPIGRFWRLDADGFIQNDAAPERILPPYSGLVADVRDAYLKHLGQRPHSIYVRGTVARGLAVEGVSDLDSFALVNCEPEDLDLSWTASAAQRLLTQHPYVTGIELECVDSDEIGGTERFSELDLLMVTQTACIWGEDVIPYLPSYKPGILVANGDISQIKPDIEEAIVGLDTDSGTQSTRYWCRRIAKNIIRAGFGGWMIEAANDWLELHNPSRQLALAFRRHREEVKFGEGLGR